MQTVLLLGGMVLLLAACGWIVAGLPGLVWAAVLGGFGLTLSARLSPRLAAKMLGAAPFPAAELPEIRAIVDALARRAQLRPTPRIYYISTPTMTAFSIGNRHEAAIILSSGLIRGLSLRELAGVLAHEISHVRHNDPWIMTLANIVRSLTGTMSFIGILLLFLNLPLLLAGGTPVPWLLVLLLTFAPTIGVLLQLALSRTREFDADLDAAGLTGDPMGLAAALEKLERQEGQNWEAMLPGGRRGAIPTLLRSHPKTADRVQRLRGACRSDVNRGAAYSGGKAARPALYHSGHAAAAAVALASLGTVGLTIRYYQPDIVIAAYGVSGRKQVENGRIPSPPGSGHDDGQDDDGPDEREPELLPYRQSAP